MRQLILFFFICFIFLVDAQPAISWQKSLGGLNNDYATSIQQTADGGYVAAGYSDSKDQDVSGNHGGIDYWIVKLDNAGNIVWQKSLGGTNNDYATSIQQTSDGGYIIAGYSASNDGDVAGHHGSADYYDYWIVKLDNNGTIEWQKSLGGSRSDQANSIQQTTDGGYIIAGWSASQDGDITAHIGSANISDYWIVKLNNNGTIQWQKNFGGSKHEEARSIKQTSDGGYIIAGGTWSIDGDVTGNRDGWDYWIVKINNIGDIQWQKPLGGSGYDVANSIQQTSDGGYIVGGLTTSNDGNVSENHGLTDYWIVKMNSIGNIQWQKSLGGSMDDQASSIVQTSDGEYITAGWSLSKDGNVTGHYGSTGDYWIVKINNDGNIKWQKSYGGLWDEGAKSIQQTTDGGYIIAGESSSKDYDVTNHHGTTEYYDYWIVKLKPEELSVLDTEKNNIDFYPNPAKDILNFSQELYKINIVNASGGLIKKVSEVSKMIDISDLIRGNYIITATTKSGESVVKKFIKK